MRIRSATTTTFAILLILWGDMRDLSQILHIPAIITYASFIQPPHTVQSQL